MTIVFSFLSRKIEKKEREMKRESKGGERRMFSPEESSPLENTQIRTTKSRGLEGGSQERRCTTTRMGNIGYTSQFSSRIRSSRPRPRRENCLRKEFRCRWRSWSNFVDETRAILPYARARNSICFSRGRKGRRTRGEEEKRREKEGVERSIDVKV